jgi:hypothetical protein
MRHGFLILLIILSVLVVGVRDTKLVSAVAWGSTTPIPGADPYSNMFPKLFQASNGSLWLVWGKQIGTYTEVYLMVNNGFGWSGQIAVVNSGGSSDDIDPSISQLSNGTIVLVWARGAPGTTNCFTGNLYHLYTESYTNGKWSNPSILTQASGDDISPAVTKLRDGRLFLAWSRCTTTNGFGDVYYKIFNNTWGPEATVIATSAEEKLPAVTQTYDGRVWVAYSTNVNAGVNQIYYVTWNGTSRTSPVQLTNNANPDDWPSIVQDRSGAISVFWARFLPNGTLFGQPSYQFDIFYKNSTDYGNTWSADQPLATLINSDEKQPYVIQDTDKKLYLVYSSNQRLGNPYGSPNLYLTISAVVKAHDLGVTSVTPPSITPRSGELVNVTVTVANYGDYTDSSTVNYYANSTLANSQPVTLAPGQTTTLTLSWNSTGHAPGFYQIKATVLPVPGQIVTIGNSLNSTLILLARGDVNRDGRVDIVDLVLVASHFGAVKGAANYIPNIDLDRDGIIDIVDMSTCGADFGKTVAVPDLAVLSLKLPKLYPRTGETFTANVTIVNVGSIQATTQAKLYANQTLVNTFPITLNPGQNTTLTYSWNTIGQKPGHYTMMAIVVPASGELVTSNNSLNATLVLTFKGDVNRDGKVDIIDVVLISSHYGTVRGSPGYLPDADLNKDGIIDIVDLSICGADFAKSIT